MAWSPPTSARSARVVPRSVHDVFAKITCTDDDVEFVVRVKINKAIHRRVRCCALVSVGVANADLSTDQGWSKRGSPWVLVRISNCVGQCAVRATDVPPLSFRSHSAQHRSCPSLPAAVRLRSTIRRTSSRRRSPSPLRSPDGHHRDASRHHVLRRGRRSRDPPDLRNDARDTSVSFVVHLGNVIAPGSRTHKESLAVDTDSEQHALDTHGRSNFLDEAASYLRPRRR